VVRVLVTGTVVVVLLYLLINAAYLVVLGPAGMRASDAVGADYMRRLLGTPGSTAIAVVVVVASLTTLNATIFTGARSAYAMVRDVGLPGSVGVWDRRAQGPVNAHLVQAALALLLIAAGAVTRQGFTAMVEYTAPVFWFFLLLVGIALFVLRRRGLPPTSYRVPLYPLTPLIFCASAAYMLHASLAYTGAGALVGVGVLALGVPVWIFLRRRQRGAAIAR
jgi:amino acid transporter